MGRSIWLWRNQQRHYKRVQKRKSFEIEIMENNLEKYKNLILEAKVMVKKMEGND